MQLEVIDPVSAAPVPAQGVNGKLILSLPANSMAITPTDAAGAFFAKPVQVWVGDVGPVNVAVIPYGLEGDKSVTFTNLAAGMTLPCLVKQVLSTGTTAAALRGQF